MDMPEGYDHWKTRGPKDPDMTNCECGEEVEIGTVCDCGKSYEDYYDEESQFDTLAEKREFYDE